MMSLFFSGITHGDPFPYNERNREIDFTTKSALCKPISMVVLYHSLDFNETAIKEMKGFSRDMQKNVSTRIFKCSFKTALYNLSNDLRRYLTAFTSLVEKPKPEQIVKFDENFCVKEYCELSFKPSPDKMTEYYSVIKFAVYRFALRWFILSEYATHIKGYEYMSFRNDILEAEADPLKKEHPLASEDVIQNSFGGRRMVICRQDWSVQNGRCVPETKTNYNYYTRNVKHVGRNLDLVATLHLFALMFPFDIGRLVLDDFIKSPRTQYHSIHFLIHYVVSSTNTKAVLLLTFIL